MNQRVIADPSQHGWVEVDGKWVWDAESGGAGAGMVISETEPTDKVEGMQWLNPTNGLVLFWDDEKWLQMPGSQDGADGSDGLWTDNGGGSISYSGNVSVSDGNLSVTSSTDTAIINLNNSIGNYEIANNEFGSIAIKYNGDERFVLASNGNTYLYGQVNAPGATITGDLRAAQSDAGDRALAIGSSAGSTGQGAYTVAAGIYAGNSDQGESAVAVGRDAGRETQGSNAVAVGPSAGRTNQGVSAVAVGNSAGLNTQSIEAVSIGSYAGYAGQGRSSIAIGYKAGDTNQGANGIIISATGNAENNSTPNHIELRSKTGSLKYNGTDTWQFSGGTVTGGGLRFESIAQDGSPVIDAKGLISTLATLRNATKDETTLEGMRDALADAIGGLIENLEHEIATMPVPEPEASTQEIAE